MIRRPRALFADLDVDGKRHNPADCGEAAGRGPVDVLDAAEDLCAGAFGADLAGVGERFLLVENERWSRPSSRASSSSPAWSSSLSHRLGLVEVSGTLEQTAVGGG
jgi:hypothetical protein